MALKDGSVDHKLVSSRHDNMMADTSGSGYQVPELKRKGGSHEKLKKLEVHNEERNNNIVDNDYDNISISGASSTSEDDYVSASSDDDIGGFSNIKVRINGRRKSTADDELGEFTALDDVVVDANLSQSNRTVLNQFPFWHHDQGRPRSLSKISEVSHAGFEHETKDDSHLPRHQTGSDTKVDLATDESDVALTGGNFGHHDKQQDIFYDAFSTNRDFQKNTNDKKGDILNKNDNSIVSGNVKNGRSDVNPDITVYPQINGTRNQDLTPAEVASESTPKPSDAARFKFPSVQTGSQKSNFDIPLPSGNIGHVSTTQPFLANKTENKIETSKPKLILTEATVHDTKQSVSDIPLSLRNMVFLTKPEASSSSTAESNSLAVLSPGYLLTGEGKRSNLKKKPFTSTVTIPPTKSNANSIDGSSCSLNTIGSKKSIKWGSDITDAKKVYNEPQTSIPLESLKIPTASKDGPLSRDNSRRGTSGQNASGMEKRDAENLAGNTQSGKERKLSRGEIESTDEVERLRETDGLSSRASSGCSTPVWSSGQRELGGNAIARALKGIKGRTSSRSEDKSSSFIDETGEDGVSLGVISLSGGLSTPGDVTPNDYLTDVEDTVTSFEELERRDRREMADPGAASESQDPTSHDMDPSHVELRRKNSAKKPRGRVARMLPETLRNSLVVILSGIYGITIVVLGLVLPLSETFANPAHAFFFEIFYLYLYALSMAFLIYVYTYLLRKERTLLQTLPKSISRTLSRTFSRSSMRSRSSFRSDKSASGKSNKPLVRHNSQHSDKSAHDTSNSQCSDKSALDPSNTSPSRQNSQSSNKSALDTSNKPLVRQNSLISTNSLRRRRKIAYNPEVSHHTGSFYLRVGVIGFGIGSMIHSGLMFGHYLEVSHFANHCSAVIQAIKPLAHLCFTFVQMYFIFMNSKMCVHKYKTLARFGLMHMCCTNICVWLRSVVVETLQVITVDQREAYNTLVQAYEEHHEHHSEESDEKEAVQTLEEYLNEHKMVAMPEVGCRVGTVMGRIVENSSVYLYPCTIEYSLVCACVLYVMWSNVGEGYTPKRPESCSDVDTLDSDDDSDEDNAHHRMSVDCAASSRGLFLGILLFVAAVVCIVCFYVLTSAKSHVEVGTLLGHISEEIILIVGFVATAIAAYQMRRMRFSGKRKIGIEEILTLVSISGLGLYGIWSIIAAVFHLDTLQGRLTLVTNLFMLIQAGSQASFTLAALRASARNHQQLHAKPGRQCVTFLLLCNFALWVVSTFETQRIEHNQTQVDFYGTTAWAIFSHISVPLGIYFRFNSTVNLSIIWKKAWKKRDHHDTMPSHGHPST